MRKFCRDAILCVSHLQIHWHVALNSQRRADISGRLYDPYVFKKNLFYRAKRSKARVFMQHIYVSKPNLSQ
jgi:hypothetical protein